MMVMMTIAMINMPLTRPRSMHTENVIMIMMFAEICLCL